MNVIAPATKGHQTNSFLHDGKYLVVPAPCEVNKGEGVRIGSLFGISSAWAQQGQLVPIMATGVFEVDKPEHEIWHIGAPIFWNDTDRTFTCNPVAGSLVGVAVEDSSGTPGMFGKLRINGVAM